MSNAASLVLMGAVVAVFGGCAASIKSCSDENDRSIAETNTKLVQLAKVQKNYEGNKRLQAILGNIASCYSSDVCPHNQQRLEELKAYQISFSTTMAPEAIVQVFKDRIVLNAYASESLQTKALTKVTNYTMAQRRDGQPFAEGEAFTIGLGDLVQVGKNQYKNEELLLPAAPRAP